MWALKKKIIPDQASCHDYTMTELGANYQNVDGRKEFVVWEVGLVIFCEGGDFEVISLYFFKLRHFIINKKISGYWWKKKDLHLKTTN